MPTLIYTPAVQVIIESAKAIDPTTGKPATEDKRVLIDVSNDLVEGTLTRRSDGVSTFNFSMQNLRRKYDYIFSPNDRIFVLMKRLTWVRVFTGYLNSVPLFSVWPRVVHLEASCSLKRLQYFYWDATLVASENLVRQSLYSVPGEQDGGIRNVAKALLTNVVKWPQGNIHIGQIPSDWFEFARRIAKEVVDDANAANALVQQMIDAINPGSDVGGHSSDGSSSGKDSKGNVANAPVPPTSRTLDTKDFLKDYTGFEAMFTPYIGTLPMTTASDVGFFTGNLDGNQDAHNRGVSFDWGDRSDQLFASDSYYCALRLPYTKLRHQTNGTAAMGTRGPTYEQAAAWWKHKQLAITNPDTKRTVICQIVGSGPSDSYVYDMVISPEAMKYLRGDKATGTIDLTNLSVGFTKDQNLPLGAYQPQDTTKTSDTAGTNTSTQKDGTSSLTAPGSNTAYEYLRFAVENGQGIPYVFGAGHGGQGQLTSTSPPGLDCSSFVAWVYLHVTGKMLTNSYVTDGLVAACGPQNRVSVHTGMNTQGALMFKRSTSAGGLKYEHVEISCGDGKTTVGEHHTGTNSSRENYPEQLWDEAYLMPGLDYTGAGPGHSTPVPSGGGSGVSGGGGGTNQGDFTSLLPKTDATGKDAMDTLFANTSWNPVDDAAATAKSEALVGIRAMLNDQPIFSYIKDLMNASLRSFCSAPNGDFIAWFPDYYGIWGTAGVMNVQPIELIDFTVDWSDDYFVTHQFVTANWSSQFSTSDGTVSTLQSDPDVSTVGIASIDIPSIMRALFGDSIAEGDYKTFRRHIYERFGPRPDYQQPSGIWGPKGEFFYALFLFMRQWAYQYNANVQLTFMPELWPGMLLRIPEFSFQAYVTTVTHSFRFGENGSFTTSVNIAAPAKTDSAGGPLLGFPVVQKGAGVVDRAPKDKSKKGSSKRKTTKKAPTAPTPTKARLPRGGSL